MYGFVRSAVEPGATWHSQQYAVQFIDAPS
jgi:hypothetical protein